MFPVSVDLGHNKSLISLVSRGVPASGVSSGFDTNTGPLARSQWFFGRASKTYKLVGPSGPVKFNE